MVPVSHSTHFMRTKFLGYLNDSMVRQWQSMITLSLFFFSACQAPDKSSSQSQAESGPGDVDFNLASNGASYTHDGVEYSCHGGDSQCPAITLRFTPHRGTNIEAYVHVESRYPKLTPKKKYTFYGCTAISNIHCVGNPGTIGTVVVEDYSSPVKRVAAKFTLPDVKGGQVERSWNY